ncbi:TerB family tellurite resistance protein [Mucilaginibacter sp. UR6-1]|uniref:TerB family tellurite resistance protein n=1 Tax=Mucilaginibacter sp. UR6-1 TaxID=1435643 RepID=UPI001E61C22D|nr:TerB family tellurite resistance protein [Mucilaginibacter sp. UR6-1]MCC8409331.1 TerB family tellurite resistance protein [Mucilaginibacter sp. UR6-1]
MKKMCLIIVFALFGMVQNRASAQSQEVQQLLLNIEKLTQFKQILSDMKKGYQVLEGGYNTIKDISQGNFSLHKAFLDGLMAVSPTVRNNYKAAEIVEYQVKLVREYRSAYNRFRADDNFNAREIGYVAKVYDNLLKESLRNLDELLLVITAGQARMSDDERLQAIDRIHAEMIDKLMFLRNFNNDTSVLALQRAMERKDARTSKSIYGIND